MLRGSGSHSHEKVELAGNGEAVLYKRNCSELLSDVSERFAARRFKRDHSGNGQPNGFPIDPNSCADNDALVGESSDPLVHGCGGNSAVLSDPAVGRSAIFRQSGDDFTVQLVHWCEYYTKLPECI